MALPEPTISEFIEAGRQGAVGTDVAIDYNRGSDFESITGPSAILWSRQTQRDTDLFKSTRFNDADGTDLTTLIQYRYGQPRITDARGTGTAQLTRVGTTGGTIWRGTRIRLSGAISTPVYYRVTADTPTGSATTVTVPIRAVNYGVAAKTSGTAESYVVEDTLFDTFAVSGLVCAAGSALEPAPDYRTRVRTSLSDARPGFETSIRNACLKAGASNVALYRGNYAGASADYGLNYVYVGDSGYSATPSLLRACTLALRSVRIAGDNLQVLPLNRVDLQVVVDVYLIQDPAVMPVSRLDPIYRKSLIRYFSDQGRFNYTVSGIETAIAAVGTETQDVVCANPTVDATILVNGAFPQTLSRYFLSDANILIRYQGPN